MESRWSDEAAARATELDGLLYVSRLVGEEPALVLWGGGNTSVKRRERTALDEELDVLRVKGSGCDLKNARPQDFSGLRLASLGRLRSRAALSDEEMLTCCALCSIDAGAARPSIETLLHAWLPARYVIHTHADAILALTNTPHAERWTTEALGREACFVPYVRPGFELAKLIDAALARHDGANCVVMEKHGLTTWGETAREAYQATLDACSRAERFVAERGGEAHPFGEPRVVAPGAEDRRRLYVALAPALRRLATAPLGSLPGESDAGAPEDRAAPRLYRVMRFDDQPDVLEFVCSERAEALAAVGPATPDHMIHTKLRPLVVTGIDPAALAASEAALGSAWAKYAVEYRGYVEAGGRSGGLQAAAGGGLPSSLLSEAAAPRPRVVLLPGLGMVTIGRDARAARIAADIYHHSIAVMRAAQCLDRYASLERADAFDIEFWPLELRKLAAATPERELARRVAIVTGAGCGIGRAIASSLAAAGAHVVVTDRDGASALAVAAEIERGHGDGRALGVAMDVTSEAAVNAAFDAALLAYGGVDILVSNAGVAVHGRIAELPLSAWEESLRINATGHFLVGRRALQLFARQGGGGNLVFVATKNALAPGSEFGAYSAAKAAEVQLARILAIEGGPLGVRANIVNPDAVFRGTGLWSPGLRAARAAQYGVATEELPEYYRRRNLLGVPVEAEDVAEAVLFFASDRSAKTTGCMLSVDGGIREAFPR